MAYAIKVHRQVFRYQQKPRNGWISAYGYTTAENADAARRFGKKESAEEFALTLVMKCPHYLGKLSIGILVVEGKGPNIHWTEFKEKKHGPLLRRGPGKSRNRSAVRH